MVYSSIRNSPYKILRFFSTTTYTHIWTLPLLVNRITARDAIEENRIWYENPIPSLDELTKHRRLKLRYLPFYGATFHNLHTTYTGKFGIIKTEEKIEKKYNPDSKTYQDEKKITTCYTMENK